jgi:hypothetical protein
MIDDVRCAVVDPGLPHLVLPVRRVAGAPHDPVGVSRQHLEEEPLTVDPQSLEVRTGAGVLGTNRSAIRGAGDEFVE